MGWPGLALQLPAARGRQRFALVGVAQRRAAARALLVSRSRWLARRRQPALMAALSAGSTPCAAAAWPSGARRLLLRLGAGLISPVASACRCAPVPRPNAPRS